jgi:cellulose 1,4-beta-cellobiosidase
LVAQQPGSVAPNEPLELALQRCEARTGSSLLQCTALPRVAVLDANWRWLHVREGYENCYTSGWDVDRCGSEAQCAERCALEGVTRAKLADAYGVTSADGGLALQYVTGGNVGSRLYVGRSQGSAGLSYSLFRLKNREISMSVDVSELPCGLNAAAYLVEMDAHGDLGLGANKAGAAYGTGYGDAQCPKDLKFLAGTANFGARGSCATEIDLVEANAEALAWTLHPCSGSRGPCEGDACAQACDRPGADANAFRLGYRDFYGPGHKLDSSRAFTAVTQFITSDGTDEAPLVEVRRFYLQDGRVLQPPLVAGSMTDRSIAEQKRLFGEPDTFAEHGGMASLGSALDRGLVLVLSIWDDAATGMQWLDSTFPPGATGPGAVRGPCDTAVRRSVAELRAAHGGARARFGDIAVGPLNSTWRETASAPPSGGSGGRVDDGL